MAVNDRVVPVSVQEKWLVHNYSSLSDFKRFDIKDYVFVVSDRLVVNIKVNKHLAPVEL